MEFEKLNIRARQLRTMYEHKERDLYGAPSTVEQIAQGFAGDANNLVKFIQAERGEREIVHSTEKIESQLGHCLWSVLTLAQMRNIDIERAFFEAMDRLEAHMLESDE